MVGCFVVGCNTGLAAKIGYHNFKVSRAASEETRRKWRQNIRKRADRDWDFGTCYICIKHFEEKFIVKSTQITLNGEVIKEVPRSRWTLTPDAVPTIFSNNALPRYYERPKTTRNPPKTRTYSKPLPSTREVMVNQPVDNDIVKQPSSEDNREFSLPDGWIRQNTGTEVSYFKLVKSTNTPISTFHAERQVTVDNFGKISLYLRGRDFTEKIEDPAKHLSHIINEVDAITICRGVPNYWMFEKFPSAFRCGETFVSGTCQIYNMSVCSSCLELKSKLQQAATKCMKKENKRKSKDQDTIPNLRIKHRNSIRRIKSLKSRNLAHKQEFRALRLKFEIAKSESLISAIDASAYLSANLKLVMKTAVSLQKAKSATGKRYPGDWILQCILLKITSPKAYNHLRNEGILPLPNPKYLSSLLSGVKCEYGFSDFLLENLKKHFASLDRKDKQVFLCFDEMKVKEAISFDRASLRFTGFIDYSEFSSPSKNDVREADHALVFMVRTLNSKLTQPFGVFATRGAAPGGILAKMIISAIVKLEHSGLEVVGVVSDGATKNKSAWKYLGICGNEHNVKYKIENPVCSDRSVYFLCDIPHIFKCIRNHFQKQKYCKFRGEVINWHFYEAVYDLDSRSHLRVVPKISHHHINPGPFQKMSVSRAVQIFSKTMADGIMFYRDIMKDTCLKASEKTEEFTRILNTLFDATNARLPKEGITPQSVGYMAISNFLDNISESDTFASELTLASLRVTLRSILELVNYLCDSVGYDYVLTSKFNQDCLEKFFGLIRSYGGDDCHPTIASFGHIFRLLSIHNPVKRAIRGNIQLVEDVTVSNIPFFKVLQEARLVDRRSHQEFKLQIENKLLEKIRLTACDNETGICQDNVDKTLQIAYYLSGYVAFRGKRFTNCEKCITGLSDDNFKPIASLLTQVKN